MRACGKQKPTPRSATYSFSGSLLPPKENISRRQDVWLRPRQLVQILGIAGQAVLQKPVGFRAVHGLQRGALLR